MRVGFNARILASAQIRGWNRYTVNLLAELPACGVELVLFSDLPLAQENLEQLPAGSFQVRIAPAMRYLQWEQVWLPRQCAAERVDLLHTPFNFGLPWSSVCPTVVTLHDAIAQTAADRWGVWLRRPGSGARRMLLSHWIARTRADQVITVSEHSKGELVDHLGVPAGRVTVIHPAADRRFHQEVEEQGRLDVLSTYGLTRPFVFFIGGWEERKNIPFLVRAFAAARLEGVDLVLAGGRQEQRAPLEELARSLGVGERLRLLPWVDDHALPALYASALCFAYPSKHEGFGLQLCEAMAAGCPTLAARASSLPEVLGDGGELFSLDRPDELVQHLRSVARDPQLRRDLQRRARERASSFSWRHTARSTAELYTRVIARRAERIGPEQPDPTAR